MYCLCTFNLTLNAFGHVIHSLVPDNMIQSIHSTSTWFKVFIPHQHDSKYSFHITMIQSIHSTSTWFKVFIPHQHDSKYSLHTNMIQSIQVFKEFSSALWTTSLLCTSNTFIMILNEYMEYRSTLEIINRWTGHFFLEFSHSNWIQGNQFDSLVICTVRHKPFSMEQTNNMFLLIWF